MKKCCKKPEMVFEKTEKLKKYKDDRDCGGGFFNGEVIKYIIFCRRCGHVKEKGIL